MRIVDFRDSSFLVQGSGAEWSRRVPLSMFGALRVALQDCSALGTSMCISTLGTEELGFIQGSPASDFQCFSSNSPLTSMGLLYGLCLLSCDFLEEFFRDFQPLLAWHACGPFTAYQCAAAPPPPPTVLDRHWHYNQ